MKQRLCMNSLHGTNTYGMNHVFMCTALLLTSNSTVITEHMNKLSKGFYSYDRHKAEKSSNRNTKYRPEKQGIHTSSQQQTTFTSISN